jgi:predicted metal-binding protein
MTFRFMPIPTMVVSTLSAALAIAGGDGWEEPTALSSQTATDYSVHAGAVGADVGAALDTALLTASQLVSGTLNAKRAGRAHDMKADRALACAAGGTATMKITGSSQAEEANGRFDANEAYQISFIDCRGAAGQAVLNGAIALNVLNADRETTAVSLSTTTLRTTSPRGVLAFIGNANVERSVSSRGGSGVTTRITAPSLDVTADFNGDTDHFILGNVDLTRQMEPGTAGARHGGTHTLAGSRTGRSFEYSVAIQPGTALDASGSTIQGGWTITLPHQAIGTAVDKGVVTIGIDDGKDGNVDRSFSLPLPQFAANAG